jgi:transcriptional regulator with XRE-family HTH domain
MSGRGSKEGIIINKRKQGETPEGLAKLEALAPRMTDAELAAAMGIARTTLYKWLKKEGSHIGDAVTHARGGPDAQAVNKEVEGALLKKALGYTVVLKKAFKVREVKFDAQGKRVKETEKLVYGEDQVHVPADTAAQRFWLTNRDGERWKNKQEIEGTVRGESVEDYLRRKAEEAGDGEEL